MCSLNQTEQRVVIAMDINMTTNAYDISLCLIKVSNNYSYDSDLTGHADYQSIKKWCNCELPNEVISKLMILFNTNCATSMKKYQNGIYKKVNHQMDFIKHQSSLYETYSESADYVHITSPIRRLVDILNLYQLSINENLCRFSDSASNFYNKWLHKLDYMNASFKSIRKVQSKCKILSIFEKEKHREFKGIVFDKQVYIKELNITCSCRLDLIECQEYMFKLYVFHDESQLKRKIKVQLLN